MRRVSRTPMTGAVVTSSSSSQPGTYLRKNSRYSTASRRPAIMPSDSEELELVTTAPVMGVRDTRRIVGEFELTIEDFKSARQFPDQVAVYNRPTDVHPTDTSEKEYQRFLSDFEGFHGLGEGDCLGVPYGILVRRGWTNLWVAGRCHSSATKVRGSIRAQSAAYMMGQAAATAPVQSIRPGEPACDLDTEQLVITLRANGAYLPQRELSKTMTR